MKGNLEDRLAQFAFGEISPSEATELEQILERDPEARRAYQTYKQMKVGLKSLSEVPEDQFSTERLRDAILTQGLKPAPIKRPNPIVWMWMPLAASVLGFMMVYERNTLFRHKVSPQIVMCANLSKSRSAVAFELVISVDHIVRVATTVGESKLKNPIPSMAVHRHHGHRVKPEPDTNVIYADWEGMDDNVTPSSPDHGPSLASRSMQTKSMAASESSPIVFIESDRDAQTGAQKATEVGNASNVLVGG